MTLPIAASAVDLFGGKRVLCAVLTTREDLGLVLSLPASVADLIAAVAAVVVVFSVGLVLLLAFPVTRLGSFVVREMVAASFSTVCLLFWLCVVRRASLGKNQVNEMRIRAVDDDCANR